jgi:hypothetical protein
MRFIGYARWKEELKRDTVKHHVKFLYSYEKTQLRIAAALLEQEG